MLKKLRIKFVCINMLLLMTMLCVILGLVIRFTRAGLEAESLQMMQSAASRHFGPGAPDAPQRDFRLPGFILRVDRRGRPLVEGDSGLTEEELHALLNVVLADGGSTGVLEEYGLRYLWGGGPETCLVFADVSRERAALAQLTRGCVVAGCAGFGALLLISLFLARWAVRPVERAWARQRQFVADASHELKTPLTVIITNAELLQSRADAGPLADSILTMARHMRGLAESLLELARADKGTAGRDHVPLDLSRLVADALLPFEALFFERGLTLTGEVEEGIGGKGSPVRLRQVVEILLDNAQKYSDSGGVTAVCLRRRGRGRCLLSVSNPGEAIPGEELDNIFKRFYRLDKARSRDGGYGLGLSIARSIVTEHHGKIWAESAGGVNTFRVELPAGTRPQ